MQPTPSATFTYLICKHGRDKGHLCHWLIGRTQYFEPAIASAGIAGPISSPSVGQGAVVVEQIKGGVDGSAVPSYSNCRATTVIVRCGGAH